MDDDDTVTTDSSLATPLTEWLLDADPAIRWQVLRDLVGAPAEDVAAERARVTTEGWGARLLDARDPDGQWMGGACFPGRGAPPSDGSQPWTATMPTMLELYAFGLDPTTDVARDMTAKVARSCRWEYNGEPFFDGGWNCEAEHGSTVSSFHSTICVLEGLLEYERSGGAIPVGAARRRGEEYLLERSLFRRKSTGEVVDEEWLQFSFPTRWHYDVLRGLEYFRRAQVRDPRMGEAIALVRSKRQDDGTWLLENTHRGDAHLDPEDGDGRPSRWNTLRSLRVLDWWDSGD